VHLDADLHASTLDGLRFFYPRMLIGGIIILHDYNDRSVPGVRSALDDFLGDKPEVLIEIWDTQALIVKL
jgi:O-methyltransferase